MSKPRKKWMIKMLFPGAPEQRCTSLLDVARKLDRLTVQWNRGGLRTPHVTVYVDEGLGRKWETFERIDLRVRVEEVPRVDQ